MSRVARVALRAPFLLAIAALLAVLLAMTSLLALTPLAPAAVLVIGGPIILLLLLPALVTQRSPLPPVLTIAVPVLALAAYDDSKLDWLRTLKDYGVTHAGAGPNWLRAALALATLALAWAMHAADNAWRLRASALERGILAPQARAASRAALAGGAAAGGLALLGTAAVAGLALLASGLDANALLGGRASIVAPLVAVTLIAIAAVLLTRDSAAG